MIYTLSWFWDETTKTEILLSYLIQIIENIVLVRHTLYSASCCAILWRHKHTQSGAADGTEAHSFSDDHGVTTALVV